MSATKKTRKVGRPRFPKGHAKSHIVQMRLNDDDFKSFSNVAKAGGQTLSEWMRGTLRAAARK